jgi:beta-ribofuranosylaminobenzene 5'-phosphate synthase
MRDCVTVSVAARLHLGFLDLNGGLGRRFGSLGLALDEPRSIVELSRGPADRLEGPQAERAAVHLGRIAEQLGLAAGHRLCIREAIPAHAGLGSGTQLALAVAAAARRLHGLPLDVEGDALFLDRSARSGIGTGFFGEGGVALDGGRGDADRPAPIISRLPVPAAWRVLLILDRSFSGIHGPQEVAAFQALPPFPAELAAHLCRLALMQALPGVAEADLSSFGKAVTEIQGHIGDHFGAAQGGRYASPNVAAALRLLAANGVEGYGQSSWGPTGFAFAATPFEAMRLRELLLPLATASGLDLMIVKGRNQGAVVSETGRASRRQGTEQGIRHG